MSLENNSLNDFFVLSAILTGFDKVELLGRGVGQQYYQQLLEVIDNEMAKELWELTEEIVKDSDGNEEKLEELTRNQILSSPKFGPIARNIIQMWYLGSWIEMSESWATQYGAKTSPTHVISSETYIQGLVWDVIESHPQAAKQPGFASWAHTPNSKL